MKKKSSESFKEYAQRWRGTTAKITTPMPEKDLTLMFINTLPNPYYQHLVGHTTSSFAEIVVAGCRIENGIISSKLPTSNNTKEKSKEATINVVNPQSYPKSSHQTQGACPWNRQFTQIPIPMSQVYRRLREENLLHPKTPMPGYRPRKYDPNAQCEYHMASRGKLLIIVGS